MSDKSQPAIRHEPAQARRRRGWRAAHGIAALSLLALSGCVAYPYGYGGYGYAPGYYSGPVVVGGGYYDGWRRWR